MRAPSRSLSNRFACCALSVPLDWRTMRPPAPSIATQSKSLTGSYGNCVKAGEIVGIAGVAGNGQRELAEAIADAGLTCTVTCIEPYPTRFLLDAHGRGEIGLVQAAVQSLDYGFLEQLEAGDLFFVDSTHTLGPAGEVSRIILEMLPRLAPGVYAHFHDIAFPYDYQGDILTTALFCWHETALLHGFLACNERFRILASLSMLHFGRQAELGALFPGYTPRQTAEGVTTREGDYPSSIYLQAGTRNAAG